MNHAELNALWNSHETRWAEWREALIAQAYRLRDEVASEIQPASDVWEKPTSHERLRYVEAIPLFGEDRTRLFPSALRDSLTEDGALAFGLALTFEHGANAYPKGVVHVPVAVRFREGNPEFAFYDTAAKSIDSTESWQTEIPQFVRSLLRRVEEYLRYDPFNGPRQRSSIGFI